MRLYHESFYSSIKELLPISKCNDNPNIKVVYLTESLPYSLFYIWDSKKNKRKSKWVTCWVQDNKVHYEEQFPNQVRKFYNKVTGYIYFVDIDEENLTKATEPKMWHTENKVTPLKQIKIKNVYKEILKYEKNGEIIVHRYNKLSKVDKIQLDQKMCQYIQMKNLLNEKSEISDFIRSHHKSAGKWHLNKNKLQHNRLLLH